ncbi:EmrB/QacA subfamily drug resistance transporter [Rathayibacter sp. PhB152]|uniref:MFS transporter n=1 Tax=Rathayibacter sp. PhB152 TaxID=2485190 RepID=UPI000F4C6863|nr:MFS transporter [Rathayibacter sp. PhB152]ROQ57142.1 EmrB/QacA subfamily drug resistance transporter [Rathayibacter sp. PhB152]
MPAPSSSRRWWVLVILAMTQLVVVLDGTIVTIALPAAQADLGLTDVERQWVVTAYALAFGALLLLGGRIADYTGRKRTYLIGMVGFGAASAWGGVASTGTELIAARGLQGAFAALLAPAALALLTVSFPGGRERNTAFAVFGAVAGAGAAVGLVLGGLLTEFADWRWCLLVNVPVVLIGVVAGALLVTESRAEGRNRFDIAGTITVALGLASLVYGFTLAEQGWLRVDTLGFLLAGVLLLAVFVRIQARSDHPLLPLRIVTDRIRGGAFLIQAIVGSVMIGSTLYLTLHLQLVLGLAPLEAGLANLPMTVTIMIVAGIATKLLPTVGPRLLMIVGPLIAAAGLLYLSRITADGSYLVQVLPGLILLGVGMAMIFVPVQNVALTGIAGHDAGAAGATANAAMQIGGSIGLSVFTTIYAGVAGEQSSPVAFVDGYSAVFVAAAVGLVLAAVIAFTMIRIKKEQFLAQAPREAVAHLG